MLFGSAYSSNRKGKHPQQALAKYEGIPQVDCIRRFR